MKKIFATLSLVVLGSFAIAAERPSIEVGKIGLASNFNGTNGLAVVADAFSFNRALRIPGPVNLNAGVYAEQRLRNTFDSWAFGPQVNASLGRVFVAYTWDPVPREGKLMLGVSLF